MLCFRSRKVSSKSKSPKDGNQWTLDAEHQISTFVSKNLAATAKEGLAKAMKRVEKAGRRLISLASKSSGGLDAERNRGSRHPKALRSKGSLVSRAVKASSSIWKMFSGATGAAKNIWSKAKLWDTGDEKNMKQDRSAIDIQHPSTNFATPEGRSNLGGVDLRLEEQYSWSSNLNLPKKNSEQDENFSHQEISGPVNEEFVYFVPNPEAPQFVTEAPQFVTEAPQFVKTDFLPSPPDQTGQTQIEEAKILHIGDSTDQSSIDVSYGVKTVVMPVLAYDQIEADVAGRHIDKQNLSPHTSNHLGPEKSQDRNRDASDLTIREPEWVGWGEDEGLQPPSEFSQTRTWTGERRVELPTEEMIISMEEQREALDQESRERRIQELALQLLHNRAILSEG